jgi:hypothetical protein
MGRLWIRFLLLATRGHARRSLVMTMLRSIVGAFACVSLFAFAAGCSVGEKQETTEEGAQSLITPPEEEPCECPPLATGSSSSVVAPPCECDEPPGDEEPPVEEPPPDEGPCPPGEHEVCSEPATSGAQSVIAPPEECICVPDGGCAAGTEERLICTGSAPEGAESIWRGGTTCIIQCVAVL